MGQVITLGLFAAVTGVAAAAGIWAAVDPGGPAARLLPLSPPQEALANMRLDPARGPVDLDAAERATRRQLALSPALASGWVRLAYIETWRHGRLTPAALEHLQRSYEVAPLGPDVSAARIALGFESWPALSPSVRDQVLRELAAAYNRNRDSAGDLGRGIRNPEGRLAIGMAIAALQSEDALKASN